MRIVEGEVTLRKSMVLSRSSAEPVWEVGQYPLILEELDKLIALLEEADLPSSIRDPKNEKLEARIRATMKRYFRSLGAALPMGAIEGVYFRYVEQE